MTTDLQTGDKMKDTARTCRCSICDRKIKYSLSIKTDRIRENRICLECAFYERKSVKVFFLIVAILGFLVCFSDFIFHDFIKENCLARDIYLGFSCVLVFVSFFYYFVLIILKVLRKRVSFKYKE